MDHACCHQPTALLGHLNPIFMSLRLYCSYFGEIWCDWTLFIWSMKCWIVMVSDVQFHNSILKWQRPITVRYSMRFLSRPLSNADRRQTKAREITSIDSKWRAYFVWRNSLIDFQTHIYETGCPCAVPLNLSLKRCEKGWEKRLPNSSFISYKFLMWYFHNLFSFKLIWFKSGAPRGEKCKYPCNFSPLCIYLQTAQYQEKTKRGNRLSFITQLQLLMKTPLPASLCN